MAENEVIDRSSITFHHVECSASIVIRRDCAWLDKPHKPHLMQVHPEVPARPMLRRPGPPRTDGGSCALCGRSVVPNDGLPSLFAIMLEARVQLTDIHVHSCRHRLVRILQRPQNGQT